MFHASLLTPYRETPEHGANFHEPPPELIKGEEEYEVKRVLNSRHHGRTKKLQFLIRWKGYSAVHDSWEVADGVHALELIEEYFQRKQKAVRTVVLKDEPKPPIPSSLPSSPLHSSPIFINCITLLSINHAVPFQFQ